MRKLVLTAAALAMLSSAALAQTVIFLDFDDAADATLAPGTNDGSSYVPGDAYTTAGDDLVNTAFAATLGISTIDVYGMSVEGTTPDGPSIAATPGGLAGVVTPGAKSLLVEGSEGLVVEADAGGGLQDVTVEVVWYTTDPAGTGQVAGLQEPYGSEAVGLQEKPAFWMRYFGGATTMQWWTHRGDSDAESVALAGAIAANTLYHDVIVLDYNDATPASSTVLAYRDGSLVGSTPFDATGDGANTLFQLRGESRRLFGIGINNNGIGDPDSRCVVGGIDSFAVSVGVLDGSGAPFVLPGGNVDTSVQEWTMF